MKLIKRIWRAAGFWCRLMYLVGVVAIILNHVTAWHRVVTILTVVQFFCLGMMLLEWDQERRDENSR